MAYRDFALPSALRGQTTVEDWLKWMLDQRDILLPVAPRHDLSCHRCLGACGYRDDGSTWPTCFNCREYGSAIDRLVPITYSVDAGLESMLHRYKDRGVSWVQLPLASLLASFVREHSDCIDGDAGGLDFATVVPSNSSNRTFSHLEQILHGVGGNPVLDRFNWHLDAVARDAATARPRRGELKPSAYRVLDRVDGARVLLLDDTWTSGSSAASTAAALKEAGALRVTVLTLGRQLNVGGQYGSSGAIYDDRRTADWRRDECVLCT